MFFCAAALETPDKIENRVNRKGKKKIQDNPTRHLWPPEWCMDCNSSSSTDSSRAAINAFVSSLPGYIPLSIARQSGVHISYGVWCILPRSIFV